MAVAIHTAEQVGALLVLTVCPNYGLLGCEGSAADHQTFTFPVTSPDSRTALQWAQDCATEAIRLVAAPVAAPSPLAALEGFSP